MNSTYKADSTSSTRQLVFVALFAALIAAFSLLPPVPLPAVPVPLTLQTLGVMLAGLVLGPRLAGFTLLLYVVLALVGLPILPGARGGLAVLAGPTGGFLIGFIPGAFVIGALARRANVRSGASEFARYFLASVVGGILVVYVFGVAWLSVVANLSISGAALAVLAFVPGDLVKAALAALVVARLSRLQVLPRV